MEQKHSSRLFVWALGTAIVILANLLFYYAITLVYPQPKIEGFCPAQPAQYNDANSCVDAGGQWTNNQLTPAQVTDAVKTGQPLGYCDANFTCNNNFQSAQGIYNRNVFAILVILGIICIVAGAFVGIEVLSFGFSWAGVLALIIASFRYWSDASNLIRVLILAFALGLIIWISVKKFGVAKKGEKE